MIGKYALSAAALLQLATSVNGQIVVGEGATDVSGEDWATVGESANLTQTQTFEGRDVTASFPGEPQEGWELRLALKDNLESGDSSWTAGTISLAGPDGDVEVDDSWNLCVHVFPVKVSSGNGFNSDFEPTCEGLVAPECVEDLISRGVDRFESGCPRFDFSPSCLRDVSETEDSTAVSINSGNADRLIGNDTSFYRQIYDPTEGDVSEPTTLITAMESGRLVLTIWGPSGDSEDQPIGSATCLLVNTVEGDSFDPEAPADGASGIAAFAGWALLSGAVAYQLL